MSKILKKGGKIENLHLRISQGGMVKFIDKFKALIIHQKYTFKKRHSCCQKQWVFERETQYFFSQPHSLKRAKKKKMPNIEKRTGRRRKGWGGNDPWVSRVKY